MLCVSTLTSTPKMAHVLQRMLKAAAVVLVSSLIWTPVHGQAGPNTLGQYNPANRTMSFNETVCIIPIPKNVVRPITGFDPLDVPSNLLPGFPQGMHPLLFQGGYQNDIRMTALNAVPLQIPALTQAALLVPYTDAARDGRTPVNVPVSFYIGGTDGKFLEAIVPSVVANVPLFEGTNISPATIVPDTAALQSLPSGQLNFQAKPYLLPNPISGPGVQGEALQLLYKLDSESPYPAQTFHRFLNSPQLLNTGLCQRATQYFNESFADPKFGKGDITLYSQLLLPTPPRSIAKQYRDVYCYQANSQVVATFVGEACPVAEANFDPVSRQ